MYLYMYLRPVWKLTLRLDFELTLKPEVYYPDLELTATPELPIDHPVPTRCKRRFSLSEVGLSHNHSTLLKHSEHDHVCAATSQ